MLSRLKAEHGHWYDLADYIPLLNEAGFDAAAIENETGLERPRQNAWIVSSQVGRSCKAGCCNACESERASCCEFRRHPSAPG